MLTEVERELVTAAVDGELSPDHQAMFRGLIAESAAAHALYNRLCRDRAGLGTLPRAPAPVILRPAVLARVREADRPVTPSTPRRVAGPAAWAPLALAASVLLMMGGASFLYFQSPEAGDRSGDQVHVLPKVELTPYPVVPSTLAAVPDTPAPSREVIPPPRAVRDAVAAAAPSPRPAEVAPPPRAAAGPNVFTSSLGPDATPFAAVNVRHPLLLAVADLAAEESRRRLAAELQAEAAVRIDLFVNDPCRAADALVAAGKAVNLPVAIDATAHDRLRKRLPFGWAVAADGLTPAEVADWLAAARAAADALPPPAKLTGVVHVVAAGAVEQKEWRELFGVDPAWAKPVRNDAPPKNVAVDTAAQVAGALQNGKPDRHAVLLTHYPREARIAAAFSKELKQFAERRGDRRPNAVTVLIVVRPTQP